MGTPDFAVPSLSSLIEKKEKVIAVVTQPDRAQGRGGKISSPAVKRLGLQHGLRIEQAEDVNRPDFALRLRELKPDIITVVSFGQILSSRILEIPPRGCLNLHPSLLPKYRGAAPINWALLRGEKKTGISTFYMEEKMDAGDIILQEEAEITPGDNVATLSERLARRGAKVLLETLKLIEKGKATRHTQNEEEVTYAPLLRKSDALIDWRDSASRIHNLVRGTNPWPGAFTYVRRAAGNSKSRAERLRILQTEVVPQRIPGGQKRLPGEIVDIAKDRGFLVLTGEGSLLVRRVQPENKKIMSSDDYLHGHRVRVGMSLGS